MIFDGSYLNKKYQLYKAKTWTDSRIVDFVSIKISNYSLANYHPLNLGYFKLFGFGYPNIPPHSLDDSPFEDVGKGSTGRSYPPLSLPLEKPFI